MVFPAAEADFPRAPQVIPNVIVHQFIATDFAGSPTLGRAPPSTANFKNPDILAGSFAGLGARSRDVPRTRAWRYETRPLGGLLQRDIVEFLELEDEVALAGKGTRLGLVTLQQQQQREKGCEVKYVPLHHHVILCDL